MHGLTNRQTTARLVIAERTVDTHIRRILAKLGCAPAGRRSPRSPLPLRQPQLASPMTPATPSAGSPVTAPTARCRSNPLTLRAADAQSVRFCATMGRSAERHVSAPNGGYASSHDYRAQLRSAISRPPRAQVAVPGSTATGARDRQTAVARQEAGRRLCAVRADLPGLRQRHRKCVRPRMPGFSPGGLGPHLASSGSPRGLSSGFPFARRVLPLRPPSSGFPSSGVLRFVPSPLPGFRFPFGVLPGSLPLSNLHDSAAKGRFRRRWSRAARAKVTVLPLPPLAVIRPALQMGSGWAQWDAATESPVTSGRERRTPPRLNNPDRRFTCVTQLIRQRRSVTGAASLRCTGRRRASAGKAARRSVILPYRRNMPARKRPAPEDTVTARRVLLDGLARDADIFELVSELAPLHPRDNTFPGEVFLHLAADALDWCGASRADPLPLEDCRAVPARVRIPTAKHQAPVRGAGRSRPAWRDRTGPA